MAKQVHKPTHSDARGKFVIHEEGDHLTLKVHDEFFTDRKQLLGKLDDATGHTALKKLGPTNTKRLMNVLDVELQHLESMDDSRYGQTHEMQKRLVGRALTAVVEHLENIGEGESLPDHLENLTFHAEKTELHNLTVTDKRTRIGSFLSQQRFWSQRNTVHNIRESHEQNVSSVGEVDEYAVDVEQISATQKMAEHLGTDDLVARSVTREGRRHAEGGIVITMTTRSGHEIQFRNRNPTLTKIAYKECEPFPLVESAKGSPLLDEIQESLDIYDFGGGPKAKVLAGRLRAATKKMDWDCKQWEHEEFKKMWKGGENEDPSVIEARRRLLEMPGAIEGLMKIHFNEHREMVVNDLVANRENLTQEDLQFLFQGDNLKHIGTAYSKHESREAGKHYIEKLANADPETKNMLRSTILIKNMHDTVEASDSTKLEKVADRCIAVVDYIADTSKPMDVRKLLTHSNVLNPIMSRDDRSIEDLERSLPEDQGVRDYLIRKGIVQGVICSNTQREDLMQILPDVTPEIVARVRNTRANLMLEQYQLKDEATTMLFTEQGSLNAQAAHQTVQNLGPETAKAYMNHAVPLLHEDNSIYADPTYISLLEAASDEVGLAIVQNHYKMTKHWDSGKDFWTSTQAKTLCRTANQETMNAIIEVTDSMEAIPENFGTMALAMVNAKASPEQIKHWGMKMKKEELQPVLGNPRSIKGLITVSGDEGLGVIRIDSVFREIEKRCKKPSTETPKAKPDTAEKTPVAEESNIVKVINDTLADAQTLHHLSSLPGKDSLTEGFGMAVDRCESGKQTSVPLADALKIAGGMSDSLATSYLKSAREVVDEGDQGNRRKALNDSELCGLISEKLPEDTATQVFNHMGNTHIANPTQLKTHLETSPAIGIPEEISGTGGLTILNLELNHPEEFPITGMKNIVNTIIGGNQQGNAEGYKPSKEQKTSVRKYLEHMNDLAAAGDIETARKVTEVFTMLGPLGYAYDRKHFEQGIPLYEQRNELQATLTEMQDDGIKFIYQPKNVKANEGVDAPSTVVTDPWQVYTLQTHSQYLLSHLRDSYTATGSIPEGFVAGLVRKQQVAQGSLEMPDQTVMGRCQENFNTFAGMLSGQESKNLHDWCYTNESRAETILTAVASPEGTVVMDNLGANHGNHAESLDKISEELREQPEYGFIDRNQAQTRLLMCDPTALDTLMGAGYQPATLYGIAGAFPPDTMTPEFAKTLTTCIPAGSPINKNKYCREYVANYLDNHPTEQTTLMAGLLNQFPDTVRDNPQRLIDAMAMVDNLSTTTLPQTALGILSEKPESFDAYAKGVNDEAVEILSKKYPRHLLDDMPEDQLARWLTGVTVYDANLTHFGHEDKVCMLRPVAVAALMGKDLEFKVNDPALLTSMIDDAERLFPNEDERETAVEYLTARRENTQARELFPDSHYSQEQRQAMLTTWNNQSHRTTHILSDVCVDERVESVAKLLDDLFHKRHFSPALQAIELLDPTKPEQYQQQYRELNKEIPLVNQAIGVLKYSHIENIDSEIRRTQTAATLAKHQDIDDLDARERVVDAAIGLAKNDGKVKAQLEKDEPLKEQAEALLAQAKAIQKKPVKVLQSMKSGIGECRKIRAHSSWVEGAQPILDEVAHLDPKDQVAELEERVRRMQENKKLRKSPQQMEKVQPYLDSVAHLPEGERVKALEVKRAEIGEKQEQLNRYGAVRGIGSNFEKTVNNINSRIIQCREQKVSQHADLIEDLGFDFGESFSTRIFQGDIVQLRAAITDAKTNEERAELRPRLPPLESDLGELQGAYDQAENYMANIAGPLSDTLKLLQEKRAGVVKL